MSFPWREFAKELILVLQFALCIQCRFIHSSAGKLGSDDTSPLLSLIITLHNLESRDKVIPLGFAIGLWLIGAYTAALDDRLPEALAE